MKWFAEGFGLLMPIVLSGAAGIWLVCSSFLEHVRGSKEPYGGRKLHVLVGVVLASAVILTFAVIWPKAGEQSLILFYLMDDIPVFFHVDALGRLFAAVTSVIWLAAGFYAFQYMKREGEEKRFFGFYLLLYGILLALDFAGNLVTLYFFYELMTLCATPLILHNGSKAAIMAALKYLFYSMCGAYCALFGIYVLYQYCDTLAFTAGR